MYPFAKEMTDPQELANVAAYIESLCIPVDHGKYEGPDAAKQVAEGQGAVREAVRRMPQGQRRRRQGEVLSRARRPALQVPAAPDDRDPRRHRRNANPDMVKVIKPYTNDQLVAISAYQSSLSMPGSMCKAGAPRRRRRRK
jgi:hypothetical protein